ncbi:inner membrane protein YjcH [Abditibacteriota bacterium]|nr:inner membrane protein YjcH [Abditibacteriota bacterium]
MQHPSGKGAPPDPELMALVKRKAALSRTLTLIMFCTYFGFVALLAFAPDVLSARVGAATLGIPVGIGLIVLAWVLTGIYVRWANGAYDEVVARLKSK